MGSKTGASGVRLTLKRMTSIARGYKTAPLIRETALKILSRVPEKQFRREVEAILKYVQQNVRYTLDVVGVETLQTPVQTLRLMQGDCDDQSMLLASLLMSAGHPCKFVAIGAEKGRFSHVLVMTRVGGQWLFAEPIINGQRLGKIPKYKSRMDNNI